jgi:hypothetical protein
MICLLRRDTAPREPDLQVLFSMAAAAKQSVTSRFRFIRHLTKGSLEDANHNVRKSGSEPREARIGSCKLSCTRW